MTKIREQTGILTAVINNVSECGVICLKFDTFQAADIFINATHFCCLCTHSECA